MSKVCILGLGGGGSRYWKKLLKKLREDPNFEKLILFVGSDDDGNHTGLLRAVLERINLSDSKFSFKHPRFQVENSHLLIQPPGDLRNNIVGDKSTEDRALAFFLSERRTLARLDELLLDVKLHELLNETEYYEFNLFVQAYREVFSTEANYIQLNKLYTLPTRKELEAIEHSIGNLLIAFFQLKSGDNRELTEILYQKGLIPDKVSIEFVCKQQVILGGIIAHTGEPIYNEFRIDDSPQMVSLYSYKYLYSKEGEEYGPEILNPELEKALNECDLVIGSSGSVPNLLTVLNYINKYKIGKELLKIIMIGNLFQSQSEASLSDIMRYLAGLKRFDPKWLLLEESLAMRISQGNQFLIAYRKEHKIFNDAHINVPDELIDRCIRILEPVMGSPNDHNFNDKSTKSQMKAFKKLLISHYSIEEDSLRRFVDQFGDFGIKHNIDNLVEVVFNIYKEILIEQERRDYYVDSPSENNFSQIAGD